jgi:hypothetical protein
VAKPYVNGGALPGSWASKRAELLGAALEPNAIEAAAAAAGELYASFIRLRENELGAEHLAAIRTDIDAVLTALEKAQRERAASQASGGGQ